MSDRLFQKKKPVKSFIQLHKLIYGPAKSSKTTLCSHFIDSEGREPFFIMTEDGIGDLSIYNEKVTSWEGMKKLTDHLVGNAERMRKEHSCIILDLYSEFYDPLCHDHICKEEKISNAADLPMGKGWGLVNHEFKSVMSKILNILPVTLLAHERTREIKVDGKKQEIIEPAIGGTAFIFGNGKVDTIGYISPAYNQISFKPTQGLTVGTRFASIRKSYPMHYDDLSKTVKAIEADFQGGKP